MSRDYFNPPGHDTTFSTPLQAMYWNGVYYPNWRIYRDQPPVSLNYDVISHVFYAFAWYANHWRWLLNTWTNMATG
jgi:chitinase